MDGATRSIVELNDLDLNGRQIFDREDREGGKGGGAREGGGGYLAGPYCAAGFRSGAGTGGGGGGPRGNDGNLSVYVGNLA